MHIFYLLVQAHSSGGKSLKVSEYVIFFFLILLCFVHRSYSTHFAMAKIKPATNPIALSVKEGSFLLLLLALHWCKDSRSPLSWIYEMLTPCFTISSLLRSMLVFTIFIPCHRSREVLHSLWSHIQPTAPSHLTSLACVCRALRRGRSYRDILLSILNVQILSLKEKD